MTKHRWAHVSRFWLLFLAGSLILTVTALESFQHGGAAATLSATYTRGVLHTNIPYKNSRAGSGRLAVEVLDPADAILGHWEGRAEIGKRDGAWSQQVTLDKPLATEDLVWQRLRYRFTYDGETDPAMDGIESISEILRVPTLHILGQQSYMEGAQAAVRVVVTDSKNDPIPGASSVRMELNSQPVFRGQLNQRGTADAQFRLPAGLVGAFPLHVAVDTPIGSAEYTQQVRIEDKSSILLTTEKPLYQPGQTIHVRALALDRADHHASANRTLTFEVEDSRGNKVFRKIAQTDAFGVASAEFPLADEVNQGTYHVHARMDANTQDLAVNVERYVLPKFKVAVEFAAGKNRHGYRPGDHVTGTVRANYFFGKAVDRAEVTVKTSGMDVEKFDAGSVTGKTDNDGAYPFDLTLPTYFAGKALNQGAARVLVEATVKDSADHSETRGEPITVSSSPLIITAVPEGGTLIPHLENQVFVLTSYADGQPAPAELHVHGSGMVDQMVSSDQGGVAVVRLPAGAGPALDIDAHDRDGNQASANIALAERGGQDQVLLRTEQAIYRAGDRIALKVLSTKKQGSAYVDVVKDGQTVLTRDLDLANGQGELALTAAPELAGTVNINAYQFSADGTQIADHRLVYVQPADELKIETTADKGSYKPGDDARIRFRVTNSHGEGVQAALGLQVVDEAVFALAEKQPGFAQVFFYLEQEAMKPRYEIHSLSLPDITQAVPVPQAPQRDRAARALFSATEMVSTNRFQTEVGKNTIRAKYGEYAGKYQVRFQTALQTLASGVNRAYATNGANPDLTTLIGKLTPAERRDAWGTDLQVTGINPRVRGGYYRVRSAGPDKVLNTSDDEIGYLMVNFSSVAGGSTAGKGGIRMEHDRGPFNGRAEIAGTVVDPAGAVIANAHVSVTPSAGGKVYLDATGPSGSFSLTALPPGEYRIQITSPGFVSWTENVNLKARDRAVVSAVLNVGTVSELITVNAAAPMVEVRAMGALGGRGGFGGGGGGGGRDMRFDMAAGQQAGRMTVLDQATLLKSESGVIAGLGPAAAPPAATAAPGQAPAAHVRSYFPEALYINPEIITDKSGRASIEIPMADSITTWRMAMLASTANGALGSSTSSLKVFQDFFVDLDLPVTLTQGDRVSIPVGVYNYSGAKGDAKLELQPEDWYALQDSAAKTVAVDSGRVGAAQFTLEARRIGKFKLTLSARMGANADVVVREIEVVPNGREQSVVYNGRLESAVEHVVGFPASAIRDASKIFVRLYPGPLSQIVEGMDAILRMPGGCFEQTSSSTYPNVLALDYMKSTKKLTPEVHAKAEGYITTGYQRLLTFEVPGGGFSWFGQAPANKILTSYGLMEFYDMSKVHDVDPNLIQRTQQWLASQQQADGSWKPDTSFINEGATNRFNTDVLRITAYIAWSLENTGYNGPAVDRAKQYIEQHDAANADSYTLAVMANFAVDYKRDVAFAEHAIQKLVDARKEKDNQAWWEAAETSVYSTGSSAAVETTGLAVQALLKSGEQSAVASKALAYLASKKNAQGEWGTTQATIMALRALLLSTSKGAADVQGKVEITLNGKPAQTLTLTAENNDLLHQFVFKNADLSTLNSVAIKFEGKGGLAYQVAGEYFTPWQDRPSIQSQRIEPLSIGVSYDRTTLAQDDIATATTTVKNNLPATANMVMIDLGIPPGFDILSEDLQTYQEASSAKKSGRLEKFNLTATQAILYFDSIGAGDTVSLRVRFRAKYPIRAKTFASRVYEYYDPDVNAVAKPAELQIRPR